MTNTNTPKMLNVMVNGQMDQTTGKETDLYKLMYEKLAEFAADGVILSMHNGKFVHQDENGTVTHCIHISELQFNRLYIKHEFTGVEAVLEFDGIDAIARHLNPIFEGYSQLPAFLVDKVATGFWEIKMKNDPGIVLVTIEAFHESEEEEAVEEPEEVIVEEESTEIEV